MKNSQKGFGVIEGLLILVIAGLIIFVSWYVYHTKNNTDNIYNRASNASAGSTSSKAKLANYQDCVNTKGSQILQTYPEQCKSASGQTFVNPAQVAPKAPN